MNGIHLGDCMDGMAAMPDNYIDLAIVDPPYGIGEDASHNNTGDRPTAKWANPNSQKYTTFKDSAIPDAIYFAELQRVSKHSIVWGANHFTDHLPPSRGWIVWNKLADIKECLSMCELAWSDFDKKCNRFDYLWAGFKKAKQIKRIHPTQKPVDLYKWLLTNYAKEGDLILDTHMGSGSSYIACLDMGFEYIGYEIDADYFKAIEERVYHFTRQTSLEV